MTKEIKTFPNIPVSHWRTLRTQFKKSIPGTISSNYLASILGMSEASAKANILAPLKLIGLIDENGNVDQDMARKYRDDNQYQEFCTELVKKLYPKELIEAFPDKNSDREKVKSWFMNRTGIGANGANRMVAFYFTLLEADTSETMTNTANRKKKSTKPSQPKKTTTLIAKEETKVSKPSPIPTGEHRQKYPGININIQVHISSDATPDQIDKIFEAMGKHIYNK